MNALLLTLALPQNPLEHFALGGLDPVALCRGANTFGQEKLQAQYEQYRYVFASEGSRAEFLKNPDRWAIQMSGACGNMGPLSGRGSMVNFSVYDGRIFIFASATCKKSFESNPTAFIDAPDAKPRGTSESAASGRRWLDRTLQAHGGSARWKEAVRFVWKEHVVAKLGGTTYWIDNVDAFQFPDGAYRGQFWQGGGVESVANSGRGWNKGSEPPVLGEYERGFLQREIARTPWVQLRAAASNSSMVFDRGESTHETFGSVRMLETYFNGATTKLFIDPATSLIVGTAYRGRPGGGANRPLTIRYYGIAEFGGLKIPTRATMDWPSRKTAAPIKHWSEFRVGNPSDASLFQPSTG